MRNCALRQTYWVLCGLISLFATIESHHYRWLKLIRSLYPAPLTVVQIPEDRPISLLDEQCQITVLLTHNQF